jgi:SAM-dependent methyltransferase
LKDLAKTIDLNSPERFYEIRSILNEKASLRSIYSEVYQKYDNCIQRCPSEGIAIEIGSGAGFVKEIVPNIITSDVIPYPNVDRVIDATRLDFPNNSLSCICMFNVLHHIPDTPAVFREIIRCLIPGGRVIMIEPHPGWISSWVYRYLHHEAYDKNVKNWEFESKGPVSDANIALPNIIFERDIEKFKREFPQLSIVRYEPHTPLRYWMTGGLRKWSMLPLWANSFVSWVDKKLIQISPRFGSFVDIELMKI